MTPPPTLRNRVALLITGSEIMDGRVHDSNAHYAARRFSETGLHLQHILACDDRRSSIAQAIDFLLGDADIVLISGGIGPTTDDQTREAVAEYSGRELILDETVLTQLKENYQRRRHSFDQSNTKQALFPAGSQPIPNPRGTAAGISLKLNTSDGHPGLLFVLPGVPHEFVEMFEQSVLPAMVKELALKNEYRKRGFRVFGLPESVVGSRIVACGLPQDIEVSYRAAFPEVHIALKTTNQDAALDDLWHAAINAVGIEYVVSRDVAIGLEHTLHELLVECKVTLSVAESCTAGMLGAALTQSGGASAFFIGGELSYANSVKEKRLGVYSTTLETHGAVSYDTAREMAAGARAIYGSTYALSISGIAGPGGGLANKPVGTFFVGLSSPEGTSSYHFFFAGDRSHIRQFAVYSAMDVLRRALLGLKVHESASEIA